MSLTTIVFNTGRLYTASGQIIKATLHDDGVVTFMDHSRKVDGMFTLDGGVFDQAAVMAAYDSGTCTNDMRSFGDGMSRGGCNTLIDGDI